MIVFDGLAIADHIANGELSEFDPHLDSGEGNVHILSSSLAAAAEVLIDWGFSRRQISTYFADIIERAEVEDASVCLCATLIFAKSGFTFEECLAYAYCLLDGGLPHFLNTDLQKAYRDGNFVNAAG